MIFSSYFLEKQYSLEATSYSIALQPFSEALWLSRRVIATFCKLNAEGYKSVAKQLADKFHFEKVAITLRESHSAFDNGWSAMLYDVASNEYCFSKKYDLHIIDRVGGGDSFGGGLIYALLTGKSTQDAVEFAVAASALKHTIEGDYNMMTVSEVEKLAGGDGSGRIQR